MEVRLPTCGRAPLVAVSLWLLRATIASGEAAPSLRGADSIDQVLVFDAGSSGTRIHVFNIKSASASGSAVPEVDLSVREAQTLKVKPGLSDFAQRDDLDGTRQNIAKLVEFAGKFVPEHRRGSTAALLKATAGLRSVSEAKAEAVLDVVRDTLEKSGYHIQPEWVSIIKGKEEGGLAWVAANYLAGAFAEEKPSGAGEPVGVIEMGGGSTQVTFQVSESDTLDPDDDFVFEVSGTRYRLYAHSYLGFGQDHAQAAMMKLVGSAPTDPCYPEGYKREADSMGTPVLGSGDGSTCMVDIRSRLWDTSSGAPGRYAQERALSGKFVATENFFYTQADLKLGWEDKTMTPADFEEAVRSTCGHALTREEISSTNADPGSPKHCFGLAYQAELLKSLKAMEGSTEVTIRHKISGADIDWALGAALVHYVRFVLKPTESSAFQAGWVFVVLVILTAFAGARILYSNPFARQLVSQVTGGVKATKIGAPTPAE